MERKLREETMEYYGIPENIHGIYIYITCSTVELTKTVGFWGGMLLMIQVRWWKSLLTNPTFQIRHPSKKHHVFILYI